jgi:uncharacterized membrane protein
MTDTIDKIIKILKDYGWIIASIGGVLLILNQTGFNINIPEYYNTLDVEGRILFIGFFNFIVTIFAMIAVLHVVDKRNESRK